MPKVNIQTARADVYHRGLKVPNTKTKSGFRIDRSQPADDNDTIQIPKGTEYYMWSFKNGPTVRSLTAPRQSQLTQSNYLSTLYSIQESIEDFNGQSEDEIREFRDDIVSQLEELRDTTQDSLDNMPEGLQQGPTGELLQERIDSLDNAISEFESIDTDFDSLDDDEIKQQIADEGGIDSSEDGWDDDITEDEINDKRDELEAKWAEEKLQELQDVCIDG